MKYLREFVTSTLVGGVLIVVPVYLAVLLLLKGMKSVGGLVRPIAALLPDWIPGDTLVALLLVLGVCFLVGVAVRTRAGRVIREKMEVAFFGRLPGYGLIKGLTQRLAGDSEEHTWQPALVEIENALVPAFIIEELDDGVRRLHAFDARLMITSGAVAVLSVVTAWLGISLGTCLVILMLAPAVTVVGYEWRGYRHEAAAPVD